jgi:hypothetical protein
MVCCFTEILGSMFGQGVSTRKCLRILGSLGLVQAIVGAGRRKLCTLFLDDSLTLLFGLRDQRGRMLRLLIFLATDFVSASGREERKDKSDYQDIEWANLGS